MKRVNAHPDNVPGGFYVEYGCCTLCGIPQVHAPELFSELDDKARHCYVRKQPSNEIELSKMLRVLEGAELRCIRYCGQDLEIRAKLVDMGEGAASDPLTSDLKTPALQGVPSSKSSILTRLLRRLFGG